MIPVYRPYLPKSVLKHAHEALDSTWISSQGGYLSIVQARLEKLLNVKHVLLLNNGTSACHLLSKCLRKKSWRKQLLVPTNVYHAAWAAFMYDKEWQLIPVDADEKTWNYDMALLAAGMEKYPDANVLIVHNVGNVINVPALQTAHPERYFVEDNCEGFLGRYNNEHTGTKSLCSAISFFGNKNITSGEGGALITNDDDLFQFAKCIQGQGQHLTKRFVHVELGDNFRMTNIAAALLLGQLEVLPDILEMKERVFSYYREKLSNDPRISLPIAEEGTTPANWMFGLRIPTMKDTYEDTERYFRNAGIEIRPMFYPMKAHAHLLNHPAILNDPELRQDDMVATLLNETCFILPSFPELTQAEQEHIVATVFSFLE